MLSFTTRAKIEETAFYIRRMWTSRDGRFRVSEFLRTLEQRRKVFKAERCEVIGEQMVWEVISRHKSRRAAERACLKESSVQGRESRAKHQRRNHAHA